jgi:Uma2 family endonuclease
MLAPAKRVSQPALPMYHSPESLPTMATDLKLLTADDLLRMPDDGCRYELIEGELRKMAPAGSQHGRVVLNVTTPLDRFVRDHDLGVVFAAETGFKLRTDPDTVRAPDVAFVTKARFADVGDVAGYWPGAPDLAIEVLSPGDRFSEVEEKVFDWLDAGTRLVIVLDPRKRTGSAYRSRSSIRVHTDAETLDAGDVVPGWMFPVAQAFD